MASMWVSFAFLSTMPSMSSMVVRVASKDPKNGDGKAAGEHEQHFGPLVLPFVELSNNDLAASDVNESAARKTLEYSVDYCVAFCDLHANNDPHRRC